ncbi:hypothetical protein MNB_SV-3-1085 [hydrothermal vent metagenome]|uniref:Beta-lactamase n=1 Tax=hydrothermal vent metagenome TaxID=652676 RepID=A0A1W1C6T0_9ZZZZ
MNQTKKRLNIINLAISITDIETIQLQILKLSPLKTDKRIQKIVSLLQAENYAQAQKFISEYIDTPIDEILQRTSQKKPTTITEENQALIDEFQLFVNTSDSSASQQSIKPDIQKDTPYSLYDTKPKQTIDFDALLNLDKEEVLPNNITINLSENFSEADKLKESLPTEDIPRDTFFDTPEKDKEISMEEVSKSIPETIPEDTPLKEIKSTTQQIPSHYPAIPYISQKFADMKKSYPPIQISHEKFDSVENFLSRIAQNGYSETEMEEMITFIQKLTRSSKFAEASELLLLCGATESKFAQFMFARALFTGSLLRKNINESFSLIHALAMDNYPEALCDLAQFYEHGIGTQKDIIKAERLYKEASDFGIRRAEKHYNRLKKQNRRLFKK